MSMKFVSEQSSMYLANNVVFNFIVLYLFCHLITEKATT